MMPKNIKMEIELSADSKYWFGNKNEKFNFLHSSHKGRKNIG